ncbi:hypothetical protein EG329_009507 [Mollisiaceae sp. DMI_Dod_QoI]|nr:hypothetical protein EG329_009507 [Helotiales sp. DMI_Dod_QoI]
MQKKGREREDGTVIVVASEATVVRVAGGRVEAAMSTLLVLSAVGNAGKKGTIVVVHHTDCGLATASNEEIKETLLDSVKDYTKTEAKLIVEDMEFGSIETPTRSVNEDVSKLRNSPFFTGMKIWGLVQDTETGLLEVVYPRVHSRVSSKD